MRGKAMKKARPLSGGILGPEESPPVRVLIVGPTPPPRNGMSVTTAILAPGLRRRGLNVSLLDTADRRGLRHMGQLDVGNVLGALRAGIAFIYLLMRFRPKVVYVPIAQNSLGFLRDAVFLLPSRLLRKNVVIHLHGCAFLPFYHSANPLLRWLIRVCLSNVRTAVVLGPSAERQFDSILPKNRIRIVANGVSDLQEMGAHHATEGRQGANHLVLYLSCLTLLKGFLDVLDAVPLLSDLPHVTFAFAGEYSREEAESAAAARLADHAIAGRVHVLGPVDGTLAADLLRSASVLVLPAIQVEGQPLCILEAFSTATPVITTRSGCIVDTVVDGYNGMFVEPRRPDDIAAAIRRIVCDPRAHALLSRGARDTYEAKHQAERWCADMAEILRDAAQSQVSTPV